MGVHKMGSILALLGFLFIDALLLSSAYNVHHYSFILRETNFTRLCTTKSMFTVNHTWPGPAIHVRKGDKAFVNVHNNGDYGVTIHWHGVKQPRNPWSDGPENITQCPIKPGKNFTYEVIFSTEEGTLWWHAHSDWSRATIHGAIVILPELGTTYPFPEPYAEHVLILGEWYNGDVKQLIDEATETGADPDVSDAFAINGQPGFPNNCSNDTSYSLSVVPGKTYLLRLINAVMNEEMFFGIAKHNMTVVAQDGAYIKPITTSYIMITPGQTMDILLTANQAASYYYIAATPFFDAEAAYDSTNTSAILKYTGTYTPPTSPAYPTLPNVSDKDAANNFINRIRALASSDHPVDVPKNITKQIIITVSVNEILCANASCGGPNGNRLAASLNNISFSSPTTDILQAYYKNLLDVFEPDFPGKPPHVFNFTGEVDDSKLYPSVGTKAKIIKWGESVEIVFQGTNVLTAENHPMHLHGFSFYLVGTGYGNWDNVTSPKTYNLVDPREVNTIGVPKNGWAVVRFVADNPGVWYMHCHLERHSSWGMDTVIIVLNGNTNDTSMLPPPANLPTCS
ncbi:laccase-14-like [Corylus avellana]|uniref:laccase-14-like n=1 Tax=Corylus avellana TaxID=13451 RepID=UPI00286B2850|nr:laccase-14-like [Corylus avellana]XP_059454013.1 laccase-14-like [Corylus avellana]